MQIKVDLINSRRSLDACAHNWKVVSKKKVLMKENEEDYIVFLSLDIDNPGIAEFYNESCDDQVSFNIL